VWLRDDGTAVAEANSHSSVVNVVAVHPLQRNVIASASDDETIRLWRLTAA
jgi:WD40 repeat protein